MQPNEIAEYLAGWIGLDAATVGAASIERACRSRQEALHLPHARSLLERVREDEHERDLLVEEVVVPESWFFRDPQVFGFVTDFATTLAAMPGRSPVRLLSVPCASGEEPFSIAMALLDAGLPPTGFRIDAFDVSRRAIARANAGRYSANAFRNADSSFRSRWFRDEQGSAVLDERVRQRVNMRWGNIFAPSFAADLGPYDVIFCRNLLIYLTDDARRRVGATLSSLLSADGLLLVGAAEPPILGDAWIPAGDPSLFAMRRRVTGAAKGRRPPAGRPTQRGAAVSRPAGRQAGVVEKDATTNFSATASDTTPLDRVLEEAGHLANQKRLGEAIQRCEAHARQFGPSPEIFFMTGMLHQSAGDLDRAEACFHKTLYLDPVHEEAALALALVASRRGDARMAEKYRESASRVFARKGAS